MLNTTVGFADGTGVGVTVGVPEIGCDGKLLGGVVGISEGSNVTTGDGIVVETHVGVCVV